MGQEAVDELQYGNFCSDIRAKRSPCGWSHTELGTKEGAEQLPKAPLDVSLRDLLLAGAGVEPLSPALSGTPELLFPCAMLAPTLRPATAN